MNDPWQGAELGPGTPRHLGRVVALQVLYAMDLGGQLRTPQLARPAARAAWARYQRAFGGPGPVAAALGEQLVAGVAAQLAAIDQALQQASRRWRLSRMAVVDRNVLRLATYELMAHPEVPRAVVIDEAVALAQAFGAERSAAFVNGLLDHGELTAARAS